ncbi:MAG: adenosylcobinamide-phosphate synthase CbiB [Gammaproteobacteria bacterium]|nr:adenosylcobinamide-phosphate synthase CbiB [Gammaproteobacteria bacterium]MCF6229557.1 adenosylcobinamide-phosphate synthase CbiB [Gammaproteobacteria bacterium]
MLTSLLVIFAALLMDHQLGEPKRLHPLVGFGSLATALEKICNKKQHSSRLQVLLGLLAMILLCGGVAALLSTAYLNPYVIIFEIVILYFAIAPRSLNEHALAVHNALQDNNIELARSRVGYMVSRHTQQMDEQQISRAAIESTLENGNDAIFGALFWFIIAGIPGVVVYRLVNTLDAMWGYRTPHYEYFGKSAAHLDDLLNYIPARLTAFSYALCGHFSKAITCWKKQAHQLASPNGGPVMSAGAGALQCKLGGAVIYHGQLTDRPQFGCDKVPQGADIQRATSLIQRTLWLWLTLLTLATIIGIMSHA